MTRRAAKSASHGGLVPLRHATRCHARAASASLSARTLTGVLVGPALAPIARRRLRDGSIAQRRRAAEDRQRRRDAQGIRQAQPMQRLPDRPVVPVFGIGDDGRQRHAGRARQAHQRQGESPFLLKDDRRGNPRRGAPRRIARPRLGQIQHARPSARRAGRSRARPSRPPGNSPPCPARRSTAAPRRPNAGPISGSSFRRGSECPCARASPRAAAATRPRPPTAHA